MQSAAKHFENYNSRFSLIIEKFTEFQKRGNHCKKSLLTAYVSLITLNAFIINNLVICANLIIVKNIKAVKNYNLSLTASILAIIKKLKTIKPFYPKWKHKDKIEQAITKNHLEISKGKITEIPITKKIIGLDRAVIIEDGIQTPVALGI